MEAVNIYPQHVFNNGTNPGLWYFANPSGSDLLLCVHLFKLLPCDPEV